MTTRWAAILALILLPACGRREDARSATPVSFDRASRHEGGPPPDFNRDVRPILADHCFRCHGPDAGARKRGLRLDTAEGAYASLKSGKRALVPGDIQSSEAARRISTGDPDEIMPPPSLNFPLTETQKDVLLRWIGAGAEYQPHWAFVLPKPVPAPVVKDQDWPRDAIDRFVLARLETQGLAPSQEADRPTLLRRVSLALTGLPPTPEETAAFVADSGADAYERQIDRLLASARYGERMAADWLDVARFADTFGYQSDWECRVSPWRDWLISAFNDNLRYDEFIRDQIAGDLLPDATRDQRLATAFNRLHRQTNEGGSIDEEFRREYISDRVHTFGTAFLGMTVECARCHDHKYDPIAQRDYYSLGTFFGAIDEAGTYPYSTGATPRPAMRLPTAQQSAELSRLAEAIDAAEAGHRAAKEARRPVTYDWLASAEAAAIPLPARHYPLDGEIDGPTDKATLLDGDSGPSFKDAPAFRRCDPLSLVFWMRCPDFKPRATILHTSTFTIESDEQGYQVMLKDGCLAWEIIHYWPGSAAAIHTDGPFPMGRWVQVAVTYDGSSRADGLKIYLDGKPAGTVITRDQLDGPATVRSFQVGYRDRDLGFKGGAVDDLQVFERELSVLEAAEINQPGALGRAVTHAAAAQPDGLLEEFFTTTIDTECCAAAKALRDARAAHQDLLESITEIMVMEETRFPRASFVLTRGEYSQPDAAQPVRADRALHALLPFDAAWPHNRLGLAKWTTDPRNPLTARVAVNRLWAICFGRGLAAALENLGVQSEPPIYQEVLDTLTADFVTGGWSVKAMLRRIVFSSTFRQSSDFTRAHLAEDPQNLLLARGPSFRLSAEALRDQALAASGLLVEKIGGLSVKPYQPPGLWEDAGVNAQGNGGYVPDSGENAHRRSLYTFRKRTAPPPNMLAFDAGSREQCLARRQPTNTPLQPLVLMNDPVFFECARALATRAAKEAGTDPHSRITRAFQLLAARDPRPAELAALVSLYDDQVANYTKDVAAAKAAFGSETPDAPLAALTLVCSTLLACDAVVTSR